MESSQKERETDNDKRGKENNEGGNAKRSYLFASPPPAELPLPDDYPPHPYVPTVSFDGADQKPAPQAPLPSRKDMGEKVEVAVADDSTASSSSDDDRGRCGVTNDDLLRGPLLDDDSYIADFILGEDGKPLGAESHAYRKMWQRLLLLHHSSECRALLGHGGDLQECPITPHCAVMKELRKHISYCVDDGCTEWLCLSSRYALKHYSECADPACPYCGPVRGIVGRLTLASDVPHPLQRAAECRSGGEEHPRRNSCRRGKNLPARGRIHPPTAPISGLLSSGLGCADHHRPHQERDSPRYAAAACQDEKVVIIRRKFRWGEYPKLEEFLVTNREEYLRHNCAAKCSVKQKEYNNIFAKCLIDWASRNDFVFDENFVAVRDRIRCYYKSFVQASRKRGADVNVDGGKADAEGTDVEGPGAPARRTEDTPSSTPRPPATPPAQAPRHSSSPSDASYDASGDDARRRNGKRTRTAPSVAGYRSLGTPSSSPPGSPAGSSRTRQEHSPDKMPNTVIRSATSSSAGSYGASYHPPQQAAAGYYPPPPPPSRSGNPPPHLAAGCAANPTVPRPSHGYCSLPPYPLPSQQHPPSSSPPDDDDLNALLALSDERKEPAAEEGERYHEDDQRARPSTEQIARIPPAENLVPPFISSGQGRMSYHQPSGFAPNPLRPPQTVYALPPPQTVYALPPPHTNYDAPPTDGQHQAANRQRVADAMWNAAMRGVTMIPQGKWRTQLYYMGKLQRIGDFNTKEQAALAYAIAREALEWDDKSWQASRSAQTGGDEEVAIRTALERARRAVLDGVDEKVPRAASGCTGTDGRAARLPRSRVEWSYVTPRVECPLYPAPPRTLAQPTQEGLRASANHVDPSPNTLQEICALQERPALTLSHKVGCSQHGLSYYLSCNDRASESVVLVWDSVKIKEAASTDGRIFQFLFVALEGALSQLCPPSLQLSVHRSLRDKKKRKDLADQIIEDLNHSTLLHLAAGAGTPSAVDLCQLLVNEFGADFDSIKDGDGRTARTIAIANNNLRMRTWADRLGNLFGRYKVDSGPPVHKSETCEVRFATDKAATSEGRCRVALKLVTRREHFERELEVRLTNRLGHGPGKDIPSHCNRFDGSHALELYRYHDETDTSGMETLCLAMPRADRSLDDIIRCEHVAGREIHLIRHVAMAVAKALQHLHSDCGIVHGDLKPRNIVRVGSRFQLIDFDASVKIGHPVFGDPLFVDKVTTAFCPPELAKMAFCHSGENLEALKNRRNALNRDFQAIESAKLSTMLRSLCLTEIRATEDKISQYQEEKKSPIADPTMDIWSFGVIMYQMLTGSSLFKCDDTDKLDRTEEEQKLSQWQGLKDSHLRRVLVNCPGATVSEIRDAKAMLKKCLMPNPCDRPQSMCEILRMSFLNRSDDCKWTPGERNCIRVLFSDPLVYSKHGVFHPIERLNFSREKDMLIESIRNTGKDIDLSFDAATDLRLQELAGSRCGCLHFSGHGLEWSLVFEDGSGGAKFVSIDKLRSLIPHHEPFKLVFVSACDSAHIGRAFEEIGVPHVICCEKESLLMDDAAANFARSFYCELSKGSTVNTAFDSAKGRILVDEGEHESKKYDLLPHDGDHDVSVFAADDIEESDGGINPVQISRPRPAPPAEFPAHQETLYKIVNAILSGEEKLHIISLVGNNASLRNNLASAAYHYVHDRLNTALNVKEIFYVRRTIGVDSVGDDSLISAWNQQLIAERQALCDHGEDPIYSICDAIKGLKFLVIFDRVEEVTSSFQRLLNSLWDVAGTIKVLLTSQREAEFAVPGAAAHTVLSVGAAGDKSDVD